MPERPRKDDDAVSLAPLTPEEALRALLAVRPDDSPSDRLGATEDKPPTRRAESLSDGEVQD